MTADKKKPAIEEIETGVRDLSRAIEDYLQWMLENGYKRSTREAYAWSLKQFNRFIKQR